MTAVEKDCVICALRDAGCCEEFIQKFLRAYERGTREEQLSLLACQRACLLECVHAAQKKLECLDYLRCHIQKGK